MFFKNADILLFGKFVWFGLIMGLSLILVDIIVRITRKNVYVYNIVTFAFWIVFGGLFANLSLKYYNYSFCWFGLLGMTIGALLVKYSIKFLFDKTIQLIYNGIVRSRERRRSGKLQQNEKS